MKKILVILFVGISFSIAMAKPPINKNTKSKFYNFSEQLIDGEIKKPTVTYADSRTKAQFDRLLSLKKSFLSNLFQTSKYPIFK